MPVALRLVPFGHPEVPALFLSRRLGATFVYTDQWEE